MGTLADAFQPNVRVGDVWEDQDPRTRTAAGTGRLVKVIGFIEDSNWSPRRVMIQRIGGSQNISTVQIGAFLGMVAPGYKLVARKGEPYPKPDEKAEGGDQFSVRLTASQAEALDALEWGDSVSERVRVLVFLCLASGCWPAFIDVGVDEECDAWRQIRMGADLRVALYEYQQAVGCKDLSAAIRSLITSGLATEKKTWVGK